MAWSRARKSFTGAAAILAAGIIAIVVVHLASAPSTVRSQRLEDGSVLALDRVLVGSHVRIVHGNTMAKLLGNAIPSNGVHLGNVNLSRPTVEQFDSEGRSRLVAEFSLTGPNATNHPLVKPAFFRQFRFVVYGERGIEYAQELWSGQFRSYPDGYYGKIVTSRFPRDSSWLGFRVERRQTQQAGGPWEKIADFKTRNPAHAAIQPWVADSTPTTKSSGGLDFVLGQVAVRTIPYLSNDIWNHVVTAPLEVRSNGILLTNWSAPYVKMEDASGNWDFNLASHRSLDPRYVWKLDADFEPESNFPEENVATIRLPRGSSTFTTNVMNVPVTISWDGYWVDASIPADDTNRALRFVTAANDAGETSCDPSGSWNQSFFRKGSVMTSRDGVLTMDFKPTKVTVAIVPNIHVTFYTKPQLVGDPGKN
jgi:hypothetical protein